MFGPRLRCSSATTQSSGTLFTEKIVMYRTIKHRLAVGATVLLFLGSACGDENDAGETRDKRASRDDIDVFDGVSLSSLPLLAAGCTITTVGAVSTMIVTVKDGESALITLRPSDNMVTVNGHVFSGTTETSNPCDVAAATGKIEVKADVMGATATKGRTVILDYINGLFMPGTMTVPGIKVDFTSGTLAGTLNQLKVRGSDGADQFAIGAGTGTGTAAVFAFNANAKTGTPTSQAGGTGGGTVTLDAFSDVSLKLVPTVMISSGAGDDRLDAGGGTAGVGTAFPNAIKLFGGDNADTIIGGLGNDTLSGGAGADVLNGCQGDDTYDMGSSAGGADVIAQACATTAVLEGNDTLDYSKRTNALTVNLSKTLTAMNSGTDTPVSGEASGDGAHISDKIVNIKLGGGSDTIVIPSNSTVAHTVFGGPGDDSFTGGGAVDTFDGETGDDTCIGTTAIMSYGARTAAVTVSTCTGTCTDAANFNDGDQSAMYASHSGTGATTDLTSTVSIATLTGSGFTAASLGNVVTLSGCTVTADDGDFTIVAVADDASTVTLDVTAASGWDVDTTCDFSEARAGTTANTGTDAPVTDDTAAATVTGTSLTANAIGHKITLNNATTTTDNGTYFIVGYASNVISIDQSVTGTFAGGVSELTWTEAGPEKDNVQCASVTGGSAGDTFTGDTRANTFKGGSGADTLQGGAGSDTLIGEGGGDNLYGGAGDDTLIGGGGTSTSTGSAPTLDAVDTLVGGDGNDVLEGDTGNDSFTCDGKNLSTDAAVGTAPGDSDITVDFVSTADTGGADCEF